MKLTDDLWDEWLAAPITDRISARSELCGLVSALEPQVGEGTAKLVTGRYWVVHRFKRLVAKTSWAQEPALASPLLVGKRSAIMMPLTVYQDLTAITEESAFMALAWARGVFGAAGALYSPKAGYYCLLRLRREIIAARFARLIESLGLHYAVRRKAGAHEVILRDLGDITALCGYLKMSETESKLQELGMARLTRNLVNRQTNSDASNIKRAVGAAARQGHLARWALEHLELPAHLQQMVEARLSNPGANLSEFGELLDPPRSKSTVKYHWDRLLKWAESKGYTSPAEGSDYGGGILDD